LPAQGEATLFTALCNVNVIALMDFLKLNVLYCFTNLQMKGNICLFKTFSPQRLYLNMVLQDLHQKKKLSSNSNTISSNFSVGKDETASVPPISTDISIHLPAQSP
jgi:hypothetical protein